MFHPNKYTHQMDMLKYNEEKEITIQLLLAYQIEVQAQINVQGDEFPKIYKLAVKFFVT